ncbi:MAG: type II secretion system protein [Verrucomicrobiota bacterium]
MKIGINRGHRGMTLIEMSIAIGIGMMTSGILMAVFNQQLTFLKIFRAQNFLTDEAPMISTYVSKLIGQADRFSLHPTLLNAKDEVNQQLGDSDFARLYYRQPDGTFRSAILSFENLGSGNQLYYYIVPQNGGPLDTPEWSVTRVPQDVTFAVVEGVLRMTLTGPYGEVITYSGTMQQ